MEGPVHTCRAGTGFTRFLADASFLVTKRARLPAPPWVISIKFSPNGSRLLSAGGHPTQGSQRSVTVWGVPPVLFR